MLKKKVIEGRINKILNTSDMIETHISTYQI